MLYGNYGDDLIIDHDRIGEIKVNGVSLTGDWSYNFAADGWTSGVAPGVTLQQGASRHSGQLGLRVISGSNECLIDGYRFDGSQHWGSACYKHNATAHVVGGTALNLT